MGYETKFPDQDGKRSLGLRCPHCQASATCRTSKGVTSIFRELFYICSNVMCGHTFKASLTYEYGLSPSACPDPTLNLPMRPVDRAVAIAQAAQQPGAGPPSKQPGLFD